MKYVRVNERIYAKTMRVIGPEGEQLGVFPKELALKKALYLAEAGITRAIWYLEQYPDDWEDTVSVPDQLYSNVQCAQGTYSVTLSSRTANSIQIESTGQVEGNERTVRVKVKK